MLILKFLDIIKSIFDIIIKANGEKYFALISCFLPRGEIKVEDKQETFLRFSSLCFKTIAMEFILNWKAENFNGGIASLIGAIVCTIINLPRARRPEE